MLGAIALASMAATVGITPAGDPGHELAIALTAHYASQAQVHIPDPAPAPASAPAPAPEPEYTPSPIEDNPLLPAMPVVTGEHVTVQAGDPVPDMQAGDRLDIVTHVDGGDAEVHAADQACLDMGGTPVWINDGAYRIVCENVDF